MQKEEKSNSEKEAEEFIHSVLDFISKEAEHFDTAEEFVETCIVELIELIKKYRARDAEKVRY